jgi:hypothetical protein
MDGEIYTVDENNKLRRGDRSFHFLIRLQNVAFKYLTCAVYRTFVKCCTITSYQPGT